MFKIYKMKSLDLIDFFDFIFFLIAMAKFSREKKNIFKIEVNSHVYHKRHFYRWNVFLKHFFKHLKGQQ